MPMCDLLKEFDKEFNISNKRELKKFLRFVNQEYRDGILSKRLFGLIIYGLFCFMLEMNLVANEESFEFHRDW